MCRSLVSVWFLVMAELLKAMKFWSAACTAPSTVRLQVKLVEIVSKAVKLRAVAKVLSTCSGAGPVRLIAGGLLSTLTRNGAVAFQLLPSWSVQPTVQLKVPSFTPVRLNVLLVAWLIAVLFVWLNLLSKYMVQFAMPSPSLAVKLKKISEPLLM